MATTRAQALAILVLAVSIFVQGSGFSFREKRGSRMSARSDREVFRRKDPIGSLYRFEVLLRPKAVINAQGDLRIFGCAAINITLLPPTLLTNGPSYKLDILVYMNSKYPYPINPTYIQLARGAQAGPESNLLLHEFDPVWKNSSYLIGVNRVQQSYVYTASIPDTSAYPTSGFNLTLKGDQLLNPTLADAIPFLIKESSKHYILVGSKDYPRGAVRGQCQYTLLNPVCGVPPVIS